MASDKKTRRFDTAGRIAYTTIFQRQPALAVDELPDELTACARED
jgi:hypothetical protein